MRKNNLISEGIPNAEDHSVNRSYDGKAPLLDSPNHDARRSSVAQPQKYGGEVITIKKILSKASLSSDPPKVSNR